MPWCDGCDRFYKPGSLAPDGTCVHCGRFIASPDDEPDEPTDGPSRAPWHFYLLIVAVVVYLGWRLVQGIAWLAHRYL
ncbi:hypothetical protein PO878_11130 [Iamia majanohamensis]|uniref:Uncharacterized protein n=1 Tax=Iamia majanohamensis TaxID=467976 RepID=A0AAE9YBL2_9ACTN|nr:hypothetical protein [Iamia majanohamensis]WCO65051.1 hypothetical protein PO878_11130 [Iamia majanohamensis]